MRCADRQRIWRRRRARRETARLLCRGPLRARSRGSWHQVCRPIQLSSVCDNRVVREERLTQMDFSLNAGQRAWQMKAREFAQEEIRPLSLARDQIAGG